MIRRYDPGQSDKLGYALRFTDEGDSYQLEVTVSGAAANSRLQGVAMVLGLGEDFPAPEVHELELTTAQACGEINTAPLEGRVVLEAVQRYEPGDAAVFEFSRAEQGGAGARIECLGTSGANQTAAVMDPVAPIRAASYADRASVPKFRHQAPRRARPGPARLFPQESAGTSPTLLGRWSPGSGTVALAARERPHAPPR